MSLPSERQTVPPPYHGQATHTTVSVEPQLNRAYTTNVSEKTPSPYNILASYIPLMPMCLAITCCVLNAMIPGMGTFISSFATCCCSKLDHPERGYCTHFWVNLSVAWLQIFTVWMFLFGWIWSIAWGVQFIIKSTQATDEISQRLIHSSHQPVIVSVPSVPPMTAAVAAGQVNQSFK